MRVRSSVRWLAGVLGGFSLAGAVAVGYLWGAREQPTANKAPKRTVEATAPDSQRERLGITDAQRLAAWQQAMKQAVPSAAVAEAPPEPEPQSPEEARRRYIERVKETGRDERNLITDARRVGQTWLEAVNDKRLDVTFDEWECYRGGCLINARHASTEVLDRTTEAITESAGFMGWNGEKLRTGPTTRDSGGKPEVTWILFAPPAGEPSLQADLESYKRPKEAANPRE